MGRPCIPALRVALCAEPRSGGHLPYMLIIILIGQRKTTYKLTIFIIVKRNNMSTGAPTVNGVARFRHVIR